MDSFVNIKNVKQKLRDKPGSKNDLINSSKIATKICFKNSKYKLVRLTCEGDLHDPNFPLKLNTILSKLKIILSNGKNLINVTKVEPWNSVRVTLNLSDDAAQQLRHLAEHGDENLREIGILSVQLDGQQIIPLNLPNQNAISVNDTERRNNNNNVFNIENNNHDNDNNNNANIKFGEGNFDRGRVIDSASNTKDAESRITTTSKQQFNRINGAAIFVDGNSENSDTTNSGSSESGNGSMIMMDVDNNNNDDDNNVPVDQPNSLNPFSNQKSSTTTMITTATATKDTSIDCADNLNRHGSPQHHQTSSSCKNESLIRNTNFLSNNNNTSDVQKSQWSTTTTPSKESPSSTVHGLSNLRISCLDQQQQATDVCVSTSSGTTSNPSTMIRTNINTETSNSSSNVILINNNTNMQSSNKSLPQKLVPNPSLNATNPMNQSSVNNNVLSQQQQQQQQRQTAESNTVDMIKDNDSLIYQRNSSSCYSSQHQPRSQQQQNVLPNQTNVTTNTSSDILGSSIDAVDDDLLTSVVTAGGAGDPNDFHELNDINLSWLDIDNNANNSNQNQNLTLTSTSNATTTTTLSSPSISAISNELSSVQLIPTSSIGTNLIRIHQPQQENKTANNFIFSQYFLQNPQNQSFQQPQGLSTKMVTNTNVMGNQNQSPILINSNNPNVQSSSVLPSTPQSTNNNNINQSDTSISSGTTTSATIFPFTSSTTMLPNSGIRLQQQSPQHHQQMSSSPRHIYIPARTQQSWPTVNNNNNNNINTASQQQQQASMAASISSNADLNATQSSTPHQQSATRFVTINSGGNSLIRQQQQSLSTNNNVTPNRPQQIMIRAAGIGNQQSSNTSNNGGQQQQNAVALSSPLLVNLLQSDVTTSSSSNNPSFQSSNSGHSQQQQFINQTSQSGTQQIRLITHNSGGDPLHQHSEGGNNTQVMTQLMMLQVSSSGGHQGGTQIINPVTVQVPTNTQTSSSTQQQQRPIDSNIIMASTTTNNGSDNNDNNNNNINNATAKVKPAKKPRKPRKSKNQIENSNTNTMRLADSSVQTSGGENQSIQQQQVNIGNNPNTNPDMPTTTYITVPTNSMAQSIVKFHQQQTTSSNSNNMQQAVLSSPNSGGVSHPIFNQNKRVQPVVMIAANTSQIDHQNSSNPATAQSQSIVSSSTGGTFFINVPVSSMMNANNSPSSMITSSPTSASSVGNSSVQLGGNRKQIFLATKSNSFPVSSARAVARFANSPSSSTPSPVKLIPQQQPQQQQSSSNNNSLTMSPNELRNISAPATPQSQQQVNLLQSSSTPIKSSPSPVPLASPIQATITATSTSIPINHANLIPNSPSSSSSSTSSTSSSANNINLFVNPQQNPNNNSILKSPTSGIAVSISSATTSPIRSKSAMEQYLLSPSQSNSNNQQQQQTNFNPQFKTFPIPKTGPSSLLNKLNQNNQQQQQQQQILAAKIQTVNMASNTSGKIPQLKQLQQSPVSIQQIKQHQQLLTRISNVNDESNNNNNNVDQTITIDNTSFVVKQPQLIETPAAVANSVPNFVEKVPQQQQQQQQPQNSNPNSISNFKKSLAEMLANTGEANSTTSNIGGVPTQKMVPVDSVFLDNNNDSGKISEPAAPISPSYFLAPASAFDIQTKSEQQKQTTEIKNEDKSEQRENSLEQQSKSENSQIEPASSETNDSNDTASSVASTNFSLTSTGSCSGITNTISTQNSNNESNNQSSTATTSSTSVMSTTSTTTSSSAPSKKNSQSFDSFYAAQDLPDHILDDDDDEEDGSDSDDDEFCFYSNRKSHFLSGSIGSIRANAPKKSEPNSTTTSTTTNSIESIVTTTTASRSTSSSSSSQQESSINTADNVAANKEPIFDSNSNLKNEIETVEKTSKIIQDNSSQCNVANGDLSSQSSSSSQNLEDNIKSKNVENEKKQQSQPKMIINPTPPASSSAPMTSSHVPIITITTKSENVDENTLILKAENVLSSVKDEIKDSKVQPPAPIEMPLLLNKPPELITAKKRRISPPVGGMIDISSHQLASKPRRKSLEKLPSDLPSNQSSFVSSKQQSSLLIQSAPDMQIINSPNLEKSYSTSTIPTISIQNNEINNQESPNKKPIFFTVKHPQTSCTHANIQISNSNKTVTKYLTPNESSSYTTTNAPLTAVVVSSSSLLPSSSSTSTTAQSTISSQNSKLFVITNGASNNLVYRMPTQGRQVVFFKQSGNSVSAGTNSFKLISNKLPTAIGASSAGGQGSSQPLLIPMVATSTTSTAVINNNNQQQQATKVISVKTNNSVVTGGNVAQILTPNDVLSSGVISNKLINEQQQQQTPIEVKKVVRSGSLPNVPIGQLKTQNVSISTSSHEQEMYSSGNSSSGAINTKTINIESNDSCNSSISSIEDVSKKTEGNLQSSDSQSQLMNKSESEMKKINENSEKSSSFDVINVETDSLSNKIEKADRKQKAIIVLNQNSGAGDSCMRIKEITTSIAQSQPIQRTLHVMSRPGNDSKVMILKTDGSRIPVTATTPTKDSITKELIVVGGSDNNNRSISPNNGNRKQIVITKSVPINISQLQHQQIMQHDSSSSTSIFTTKSNNNPMVTKTLPSILRQSKRKSDNLFPNAAQSIPITLDPPTNTNNKPSNIVEVSDSSEIESSESSSSVSTIQQFQQQQLRKFPSLLSNNDDESISDISDSTTVVAARPKKRARKSKVTPIQQLSSIETTNTGTVYMNVSGTGISFGQNETSEENDSETTHSANSRVLRNSITTIPSTSTTPIIQASKRVQRNRQQIPSPTNTKVTFQAATSTFISTAAESPSPNSNEKTKRVRKVNTTTSRPTRSRTKKLPDADSSADASDQMISPTNTTETFVVSPQDSGTVYQTSGSSGNLNLPISTIITSDGSVVAASTAPRPTSNCVGRSTATMPSSYQQIIVSHSGGSEHFVSLLDSSNITSTNPSSTMSSNNNNSLLAKRPKKSLQPSPSSSTTTATLRPMLRHTSTESIPSATSPPPPTTGMVAPSPNKRRRLATKDVAK